MTNEGQFEFACPHCKRLIPADNSECGESLFACPFCGLRNVLIPGRGRTKYAFYMTARQGSTAVMTTNTALGFVEAVSKEEAEGKALRICRAAFPIKDGWYGHFAHARSIDDPAMDPDLPIEYTITAAFRS
jgi:hypothetical protein